MPECSILYANPCLIKPYLMTNRFHISFIAEKERGDREAEITQCFFSSYHRLHITLQYLHGNVVSFFCLCGNLIKRKHNSWFILSLAKYIHTNSAKVGAVVGCLVYLKVYFFKKNASCFCWRRLTFFAKIYNNPSKQGIP